MKETMTPQQRLAEVSEILANAIVRLRLRAALPGADSDQGKSQDSSANCLDAPPKTVLSVHTG
jgi:hypothetical protein